MLFLGHPEQNRVQLEPPHPFALTVTTDIPWVLERNGWRTLPKENGSQFDTFDQCPACKER